MFCVSRSKKVCQIEFEIHTCWCIWDPTSIYFWRENSNVVNWVLFVGSNCVILVILVYFTIVKFPQNWTRQSFLAFWSSWFIKTFFDIVKYIVRCPLSWILVNDWFGCFDPGFNFTLVAPVLILQSPWQCGFHLFRNECCSHRQSQREWSNQRTEFGILNRRGHLWHPHR